MRTVSAFQIFVLSQQAVTIVVYWLWSKSALSTETIGEVELLFYLGYALTFYWLAGLLQAFLRQSPRVAAEQQQSFRWKVYCILMGLVVVVASITWWGRSWLVPTLTQRTELPLLGWFLGYLILNLPASLTEHLYVADDRGNALLRYATWSLGSQLLLLGVLPWSGFSILTALQTLVVVGVARHGWLLYELSKNNTNIAHKALHWTALRPLWWGPAVPLMGYAFFGGIAMTLDGWLVNYHYDGDAQQFAIFRYGARELPLVLVLTAALSNAMLPKLGRNAHAHLPELRRSALRLMHLLFPLSIVLMWTSSWIYPWVFNADFAPAAAVFNVLLLVLIPRVVFSHTVLLGVGEERLLARVALFELFINLACSFWLVQTMGLPGIALGTVIAYSFEKIVYAIRLYDLKRIALNTYLPFGWWLIYSTILLISYLFTV